MIAVEPEEWGHLFEHYEFVDFDFFQPENLIIV